MLNLLILPQTLEANLSLMLQQSSFVFLQSWSWRSTSFTGKVRRFGSVLLSLSSLQMLVKTQRDEDFLMSHLLVPGELREHSPVLMSPTQKRLAGGYLELDLVARHVCSRAAVSVRRWGREEAACRMEEGEAVLQLSKPRKQVLAETKRGRFCDSEEFINGACTRKSCHDLNDVKI